MSSIITSILSSVVGLLWNKARDTTAKKLKDGDVTDAQIRAIVVRELNDVNSKIDALSRRDQLSSYRFLKEGIDLLVVALDKAKRDALNEGSQDERQEASSLPRGSDATGILTKAIELSHAMGKLKIKSDKELDCAKNRFTDARKRATDAFCNEALSIKDRLFAAKLRVVSEILEWLESPTTAIAGCMSFLQELHRLPAIREIFSVFLNGGPKSIFNKAERVENVRSVMLINYVLFQFVSKFSKTYAAALVWPTIEIGDHNINPIYEWQEVSTRNSWGEELIQPPNKLTLNEEINPYRSAVNSRGQIVTRNSRDNIMCIFRTGEFKVVKVPYPQEGEIIRKEIVGLTVDHDETVYVVRNYEIRIDGCNVKSYFLHVLDEDYNIKFNARLDFLKTTDQYLKIAINKSDQIIMILMEDPQIYVCDKTGNLKHKFERESRYLRGLEITKKNEIMIPSDNGKVIHIYTVKGEMQSKIKLPEGYQVCNLAFHHIIGKIIVLTYAWEKKSPFLLFFSEIGELENFQYSTKIFSSQISLISPSLMSLTSHPGGPVAVVSCKSITFL